MRTTNWLVITGAPCSGKTAVINRLEDLGFRVVHEAARAHINEALARGETLAQIRSDEFAFENRILDRKIAAEAALPADQAIFLDRAIPDSIAYFENAGLDPGRPLKHSGRARYRQVFFFDRLGFEKDGVRREDEAEALRLESLLEKCYLDLGYTPVRVPPVSVKARTDFILHVLSGIA